MAYVRQHGNQLEIVHGQRDRETGKVRQRVLFSLYSRPEALAALTPGAPGQADFFRQLLELEYPDISFNWKKIWWAVARKLDALPEDYEYRESKLLSSFHQDLIAATRQLALCDPQWLASSAAILREHRFELEYLRDLISWRLKLCDPKPSKWTEDNPFLWRLRLRGGDVPYEAEEQAAEWFYKGEYDRAQAVFRLLIDCFPSYADGYNYLGLIALERDDLEVAEAHFTRMLELLRPRLPRRMTPRIYQSHNRFRPYRRTLNNLAVVFNRTGRYERALELCEKLESECGADVDAAVHRASIYLNRGAWTEAVQAAAYVRQILPSESCISAFGLFESGRLEDAVASFLHGSLNYPATAAILAGRRWPAPQSRHEWEDSRRGQSLRKDLHGYYANQSLKARRFFKRLSLIPELGALLREVTAARRSREAAGKGKPDEAFRKLQNMLAPDFARERAPQLTRSLLT
jgi:tetratricopeptide (TPR) repeat protein